MNSGVSIARWVFAGLAMLLLGACAGSRPELKAALNPGMAAREVGGLAGPMTVRFSYLADGRKYDLVTAEPVDGPLWFENARLRAVLPDDAMPKFDQKVRDHLKAVELPFEKGVGEIHGWLIAQARIPSPKAESATTAGDVGEAVASGVILAPIAPILFAGGVCAVTSDALSGSERKRGQLVNDALLADGPGYRGFLSSFKKPALEVGKGGYQVRQFYATEGAFFTGMDFYYDVGFRNGQAVWVSYRDEAVRQQTYRYWDAHR